MELGQHRTARLELSKHQIRDNVNNALFPQTESLDFLMVNGASIWRWCAFCWAFFCSFWFLPGVMVLDIILFPMEIESVTFVLNFQIFSGPLTQPAPVLILSHYWCWNIRFSGSAHDLGEVRCWGGNEVGESAHPCVFRLVAAGSYTCQQINV